MSMDPFDEDIRIIGPHPLDDILPERYLELAEEEQELTETEITPAPIEYFLTLGPGDNIATGGQQINPVGEVDTWGIEMRYGAYTVVKVTSPAGLDSSLTVHDPSGTLNASSDTPGPNSALTVQSLAPGTYTFTVGGVNGTTGPYHIQATNGLPYGPRDP